MPGKNKPKRLDRHRGWRIARRKKRLRGHLYGGSRNRQKRPKVKAVKKV